QRMTTRQRHQQPARTYRVLIDIVEEVVGNARAGLERTRTIRGKDVFTDMAIEELRGQIEHFCHLGDRVIDQAHRRVLLGEQLATDEKIYSIFEPHTDLIKRGKVRTPVEFGHKVFLAESAAGLITQYEVLRGNPPDEVHVAFSLQRHRQCFGRAPQLYGSDRGFFSEQNLASCKHAGVKVVCIPQRGGERTARREAYEKSTVFKCQIAPKCDPLFAAKNDPFDGAETGGAEPHIAEQSRSWRAAGGGRGGVGGSLRGRFLCRGPCGSDGG